MLTCCQEALFSFQWGEDMLGRVEAPSSYCIWHMMGWKGGKEGKQTVVVCLVDICVDVC